MKDELKDLIVVKRTGQRVAFNGTKIAIAIGKGFDSVYENSDVKDVNKVYELVLKTIAEDYKTRKTINVEDIQNIIEESLKKTGYMNVYNSFSDYRLRRAKSRDVFGIRPQHKFVKAMEKVGYLANEANDQKPNELINSFAEVISKEFATAYLIEGKVEKAIEEGSIAINGINSYTIGTPCSSNLNIDFEGIDRVEEFFNEIIRTVIEAESDQYEEQVLMNFDSTLKSRVLNDFKEIFFKEFLNNLSINGIDIFIDKCKIKECLDGITDIENKTFLDSELKNDVLRNTFEITYNEVIIKLNELLKSNFNRMFTIFDSILRRNLVICLDNDKSFISNMIIINYFSSLKPESKIITNIFITDDDGINELIYERLRKNKIRFLFGKNHDISYFSNGVCIFDNINGTSTSKGRVINSISTINLARLALKNSNQSDFFKELDNIIELAKNALTQRFELQSAKTKENYNVLFNKGLLYDSEKLEDGQKVRKILRNGAFVIGFVGLVEAVFLLNKKEDNKLKNEDFELAAKVIKAMNKKCEKLTNDLKLNFITAEIYDDAIINNFIRIDKSVFGSTKTINKNCYEPVSEFINQSKLSFETQLMLQAKYQNLTSSLCTIDFKGSDLKKFLKLLTELDNSKVKYVEVINDN